MVKLINKHHTAGTFCRMSAAEQGIQLYSCLRRCHTFACRHTRGEACYAPRRRGGGGGGGGAAAAVGSNSSNSTSSRTTTSTTSSTESLDNTVLLVPILVAALRPQRYSKSAKSLPPTHHTSDILFPDVHGGVVCIKSLLDANSTRNWIPPHPPTPTP